MPLPLAYLDAAVVEEVPVDLWRQTFAVLGWPASLRTIAETFTHDDVVAAFGRDDPTDELLQLLEVIHTLGTETGADAIQTALDDQRVPRDVLPVGVSAREFAVHLFLAQRRDGSLADVFARAQIQVQARSEQRRYDEFLSRAPRGVHQLPVKVDALQAATRAYCEANDLGDHVQVRAFEDDGAYVFQILRSHRTRKPLAVVAGHAARAMIEYRPVHGDLLRYEAAVGRLRIAARTASVVGFYRRALGGALFADEEFFTGDPVCSLRVLQNGGRAVLDRHDVVGIGRVRMTECLWERGDRELIHLRAPDCFRQIEALQLPLAEGTLLQAKLKIEVIGTSTRPMTVSIRAPSRIEVSQARHEALADRFLTEVGIRGRSPADSTPTLWSLAPWRHPLDVWRAVFGRDTDRLIERGVLKTTRLVRVAHADAPEAGQTLEVVSLDNDRFYGVSADPSLPSRTLTATDLDGFELQPELFRQFLRSQLGITGMALSWDDDEAILDLGAVTVGEQRLFLAYAIRSPSDGVSERLRQRAGGAPIVLLCPSTDLPILDVPAAPLEHPVPTLEQAVRSGVTAAGLQQVVPAIFRAPEGVRLVVDRTRGMIWLDQIHISGLKPETQQFHFVTLLAEAMGRPVESLTIKSALSHARPDGDTATRQAKTKANHAIREAMAAAGRTLADDPFPNCGTGLYRCALPSFVA
jgi:hypothetical protein